jgi:hypothetical protein
MFATAAYLWSGTEIPAACSRLENSRVVVVCRPPTSLEYRDAGASRDLAKRIGALLEAHGEQIEVVSPAEVENWADESDGEDFLELAKALEAQMVLHVELTGFSLHKGPTLYQGQADGTITVYDMQDNGNIIWEKPLDEVLFPANSAVPAQEKPLRNFRRQFIDVLAENIAQNFYGHDPRVSFALDATAHR